MSGRSKFVLFGSIVLLAALFPPIAYMVIAPKDMLLRVLIFVMVVLCAGLWSLGAPFLWKMTEWWYRLERKRWGRRFNRGLERGLEAVGIGMMYGASSVLWGAAAPWSSPFLLFSYLLLVLLFLFRDAFPALRRRTGSPTAAE